MRIESIGIVLAMSISCGGSGESAGGEVAGSVLDGPPAVPAGGTTYYVSPSGSNANPGTLAAPWRTPGFASKQLKPGETLVLLAGTYDLSVYDDDMITPASGVATNWIVIKGQEGTKPVLRGSNNLLAAVDLGGKSYVKLQNLEITSQNGASFREAINGVGSPMTNLIFQDLYIHHVDEFGIDLQDIDQLWVYGCDIRYCGFGSIGGPEASQGGWRNVVMSGCNLSYSGHYYQGGPGPSPYDRPDGFGIEASDGPVEIRNTKAEHNRGDGLDCKAKNAYIHECVVANNSCDGVKLWGSGSKLENVLVYGRGDGSSQTTPWSAVVIAAESGGTFQLINVTVDDKVGKNYVMHVQYDTPSTAVTLTMKNCIWSSRGSNAPIYFAPAVNYALQNNLFYMPASGSVFVHGSTAYSSQQLPLGNLYGDPKFAQLDSNYHLQTGSLAIDSGSVAPAKDLDGVARPQGGGVDVGAYEK